MEFFYSIGQPPEHYHASFRGFLVNNGPRYKVIRKRIQDYSSTTCGLYCLFYSLHRCLI